MPRPRNDMPCLCKKSKTGCHRLERRSMFSYSAMQYTAEIGDKLVITLCKPDVVSA